MDTLNYTMRAITVFLASLLELHISAAGDCRCSCLAVLRCRTPSRTRSSALLKISAVVSAGCTFDSLGGEAWAFAVWHASLVINTSTVSNTRQRSNPINYSAADSAFRYNGVVAVSGESACATVLVCPSPLHRRSPPRSCT